MLGLFAVTIVLAIGVLAASTFRLPLWIEWLIVSIGLAGCFAAIFSVGLFFLPAVGLMLAAAASRQLPSL